MNSWAFPGLNHMKEISNFEVQYPLVMLERGLLQDFCTVCYARIVGYGMSSQKAFACVQSVFFIGDCFVNIYVGMNHKLESFRMIQVYKSDVIFKGLCTQIAQCYECCFFFLLGFAYNLFIRFNVKPQI